MIDFIDYSEIDIGSTSSVSYYSVNHGEEGSLSLYIRYSDFAIVYRMSLCVHVRACGQQSTGIYG